MHDIHFVLLVFTISIIVASLVHQPILNFAKSHYFYDNPEARKLQREPIPVMGGFVVFVGALIGSLFYWLFYDCSPFIPVQIAMFLMLIVGAWDDIKKLSPNLKFAIEVVVDSVNHIDGIDNTHTGKNRQWPCNPWGDFMKSPKTMKVINRIVVVKCQCRNDDNFNCKLQIRR